AGCGFAGPGFGPHVIQIEVARGRRAGVAVDGFEAGGARIPDAEAAYRWSTRRAGGATRHGYDWSDDRHAEVRFRFRGTAIRWITARGRDEGRAAAYLDGQRRTEIARYLPSP